MDSTLRTLDEAPLYVRQEGGVVLSLWLLGAGETDVEIVAHMEGQLRELRSLLREVAQSGVAFNDDRPRYVGGTVSNLRQRELEQRIEAVGVLIALALIVTAIATDNLTLAGSHLWRGHFSSAHDRD